MTVAFAESIQARARKWRTAQKALPADTLSFARQCCVTFDEQGSDVVTRPFPKDWEYTEHVFAFCDREKKGRIDKSGQVLVSWCVLVWILHKVLSNRGWREAYYCQTQTKALGHLKNRLWRMYLSIPAEYAKPHAELVNGVFQVYHDGPEKLATSFVMPQAAEQSGMENAADKMRSETWTHGTIDEGAFPRNLKELVGSLLPRCGGLLIPSTANGENWFHLLGFGDIHDEKKTRVRFEQIEDKQQVCRGVWQWRRNGFAHLRVHYSARPDRNPETPEGAAWVVATRESMPTDLWEREEEINYEIEPGAPVFCDTERIKVCAQVYQPWMPLVRGHDYSFAMNVCLVTQIRPSTRANGSIYYKLHVIKVVYSQDCMIQPHAERIKAVTQTLFPEAQCRDVGDYSANQRSSTGVLGVEMAKVMGPEFALMSVPTGPGGVRKGLEIVQQLVSEGLIEIDNTDPGCAMLVRALKSGYVRDPKSSEGDPLAVHPWADFVDPLRYIAINFFENVQLQNGGQEVQFTGEWRGLAAVSGGGASAQLVNASGQADVVRADEYRGRRGGR